MGFLRREGKTPAKIRATKAQAIKLAAEAQKESETALKGFKSSFPIILVGLVPVGVLGVYAAQNNVQGDVGNTITFLVGSIIICLVFLAFLSRRLVRTLNGLEGTIEDKGLAGRLGRKQ